MNRTSSRWTRGVRNGVSERSTARVVGGCAVESARASEEGRPVAAPESSFLERRPYSRVNSAMKCSARSVTSASRSRSGGTKIGMTLRRK